MQTNSVIIGTEEYYQLRTFRDKITSKSSDVYRISTFRNELDTWTIYAVDSSLDAVLEENKKLASRIIELQDLLRKTPIVKKKWWQF